MLLSHLDEADEKKIIGLEMDYEKAIEKWETDATIYKKADASTIMSPQTMWKDEVSSPAFRQLPKKANESSHGKGGTTRKKDMKSRIPWWPELLDKKKIIL